MPLEGLKPFFEDQKKQREQGGNTVKFADVSKIQPFVMEGNTNYNNNSNIVLPASSSSSGSNSNINTVGNHSNSNTGGVSITSTPISSGGTTGTLHAAIGVVGGSGSSDTVKPTATQQAGAGAVSTTSQGTNASSSTSLSSTLPLASSLGRLPLKNFNHQYQNGATALPSIRFAPTSIASTTPTSKLATLGATPAVPLNPAQLHRPHFPPPMTAQSTSLPATAHPTQQQQQKTTTPSFGIDLF